MKKITLIIGILIAANILYAQNKKGKMRHRAEVRIEEHKERLNLSEDQVEDLEKLKQEMKPQFEEIKKNESLSRPDKMRAHADLLEERQTEVEKILDDEQLAELEEIRKEFHERRKERMEERDERRGERRDG